MRRIWWDSTTQESLADVGNSEQGKNRRTRQKTERDLCRRFILLRRVVLVVFVAADGLELDPLPTRMS